MKRTVPLLDLKVLHAPLREELADAISQVMDTQRFILGANVQRIEQQIAEYCGVKYAVGCASGTDALYLALLAAGIGPGDHVLTTPYSFFATAGMISRAGAKPVFADIEEKTFNLNAEAARTAFERDPKIRALIPVHLFGACADLDPLLEMARGRGCFVIEDGAQSIGSEYKGRRAQSIGDMGCISFFPSKNLGAFGDGGMVTTTSETLYGKLRLLHQHGSGRKYYHEIVGINSRLDALQAAVLLVKLPHLDSWTAGRQQNAARYGERLKDVPEVITPGAWNYQTRSIYNQFVIRADRRDELRAHLEQQGIGTEIYYPVPFHLQECFRDLGYREGDFPISEAVAKDSLALPIHSALAPDDLDYICESIAGFYR